jgi:hypothetical protein
VVERSVSAYGKVVVEVGRTLRCREALNAHSRNAFVATLGFDSKLRMTHFRDPDPLNGHQSFIVKQNQALCIIDK